MRNHPSDRPSLPSTPSPSGPPAARLPPENVELFDYAHIRRQLGFVFRSLRRHPLLFGSLFLLMVTATCSLAVMWPRTYHVQTKILAQRNQVMAALGNPHRSIPTEADAPTRAASETVLRRDNLVSLVKQTNLIDSWDSTRIPLMRLKDRLISALGQAPSDEDKLDGLIAFLEKRLTVQTGEGTVTIAIDWPNGASAYRLVEAAQQNFLEARHVTEVSTIEEAISILEAHAENLKGTIERTLEEIQKLQTAAPQGSQEGRPALPRPRAAPSSGFNLGEAAPEQELSQIKFMLRAKQRAIADLEEFRTKRLAELHAQLQEQKVIYSEQHPVVLDTQQRIAALNQESPQIAALKKDEQDLRDDYKRHGGRSPDSQSEPSKATIAPRPTEGQITQAPRVLGDSPQLAYAREQLRIATDTYQDILLRIDAARIELDTARAAFKYRYSVVNPAQLPKRAEKPNVPLLIVSGIVASFVFAVLAALLRDTRRGLFIESWQLEEKLGLPLLAEVRSP